VVKRERLDLLIVDRGLAESRAQAQRLVMAGQVRVEGEVASRPGQRLPLDAAIDIERPPRFVSRGGEKLEAALAAFPVPTEGRACADVGASTGGFTDCLLQRGARRVYAIDVGHGILHWRLREDPRVTVLERTNARRLASLPEPVDLVTVDASFISLRLLLPPVCGWLKPGADLVLLVKPQFEAGREAVGRGGVVRRAEVHREVLRTLIPFANSLGLAAQGMMRSPLLGPKGNAEFLLWCRQGAPAVDLDGALQSAAPDSSRAERPERGGA
jgi:23S rRNA (cytidine1920-2'-O)/16S rRNA (cytidine1409-2'-O)-methyltransferase